MKTVHKCDFCGEDFPTKKECLAHEKECGSPEKLRERIKELEEKVEMLEMMLRAKESEKQIPTNPQFPTNPSWPNTDFPVEPWKRNIWWCNTNDNSHIENSHKKEPFTNESTCKKA